MPLNLVADCPVCGKEFIKKKASNVYCSRECAGRHNVAIALQRKKDKGLKGQEMKCVHCGKLFYVAPYRISEAQFCSLRCKALHEQTLDSAICPICGKSFTFIHSRLNTAKYCSRTCYYKGQLKKGTVEFICKECGKTFLTSPSHKKIRKYCSKECMWMAKRKSRPTFATNGGMRNYMKSRGKIKECQDCGYSEHPEILGIHHIDFNHENNMPDNIAVLCPNCHSVRHAKHTPHTIDGKLCG